ncbi:hypothetical protein Q3G72_012928 [Acer saccharum]|nr:hypothetical protein Q3G72_020397 [Acer saccharum]KAK1554485.1 hypothetical protein Q3G72_012928 [Acer saccharum]
MNCLLGARICFPSLFSFFFFIFIFLSIGGCLRLPPHHHYISVSFHEKSASAGHQPDVHHKEKERAMGEGVGMEVYPTGSSLPDCSHACGPCFPCKRVMVSFKCSIAESCPIVYRCMCKGKYYHVPSN